MWTMAALKPAGTTLLGTATGCSRAGNRHASDSPPLDRLTTIRRGVGVSGVPRLRIAEWPRRIQVRQTVDPRWQQGISIALLGLSKEPPRRRARRSSTSSTLSAG